MFSFIHEEFCIRKWRKPQSFPHAHWHSRLHLRKPISFFSVTSHSTTLGPGKLLPTNQAVLLARHCCDPLMVTVDWMIFASPESSHTMLMNSLLLTLSHVVGYSSENLEKSSILSRDGCWSSGVNESVCNLVFSAIRKSCLLHCYIHVMIYLDRNIWKRYQRHFVTCY